MKKTVTHTNRKPQPGKGINPLRRTRIKSTATTLIMAIILSTTLACAQEKKELVDEIDRSIRGIEGIIELSNTRLVITSANDDEFDPANDFNFEGEAVENVADSTLARFFKERRVGLSLMPPYNFVSIDKKKFDLIKLLGQDNFYFSDNADLEPVYTPLSFTFRNGTTKPAQDLYLNKAIIAQKHRTTEKDEDGETYEYVEEDTMDELEQAVWESGSFDETFAVLSAIPLAKVTYEVKLPFRSQHTYQAEATGKPIRTAYGDITIDTIAGQTVYCRLPITAGKQDIRIRAYYRDGRILKQKSSSSNSVVTEKDRTRYAQMLNILNDARNQVKKGKLKTKDQLAKYMEDRADEIADGDTETVRYKDAVYSFAGPVSRVEFVVNDTALVYRNFVLEQEIRYNEEEQDYLVATDWDTEKKGIINNNGEWVIQPQYEEHFRIVNRYYYRYQIDYTEDTYLFNPQNKTMQKVNYRVNDPKIYAGSYVKIESKINGLKGVADALTGKIIIPMEHAFLDFAEPGIWYGRNEETQLSGAYRTEVRFCRSGLITSKSKTDFYTRSFGQHGCTMTNSTMFLTPKAIT